MSRARLLLVVMYWLYRDLGRPTSDRVLGGMSEESSAEYYRLAKELARERVGGLLPSVDFADIEHLQVRGLSAGLCTAGLTIRGNRQTSPYREISPGSAADARVRHQLRPTRV